MRVDYHRDSQGTGATDSALSCASRPGEYLIIDAGIEQLRIQHYDANGVVIGRQLIPTAGDLRKALLGSPLFSSSQKHPVYITGKLAEVARNALGYGEVLLPTAVLWTQAQALMAHSENSALDSLAIIDLSASGYLVLGIDRAGELKNDLLAVNPRCGAGSGVNIDRVLQKLAMKREGVDHLLARFLGEQGR